MSTLSRNLRLLRENKRISQMELAKIIKVSNKSLSAYENGRALPDIDTLVLFADYFDITIDNMVGRLIPTHEVTPEDQALIAAIKKLKPEHKQVIKDIINSFIKRMDELDESKITKASK